MIYIAENNHKLLYKEESVMTMFCCQCQEAAGGRGCTIRGVCGNNERVAKLQDLLIYTLTGISDVVGKG